MQAVLARSAPSSPTSTTPEVLLAQPETLSELGARDLIDLADSDLSSDIGKCRKRRDLTFCRQDLFIGLP